MQVTLPLDKMTTAEKLQVMEQLWADLSREEARIESPAWHENVLKQRVEAVKAGKETFIDWDVAKRQLRKKRK